MRAEGPLTALPVAALSTEQTHTIMTPGQRSHGADALTTNPGRVLPGTPAPPSRWMSGAGPC
jgi:hypothetical protein